MNTTTNSTPTAREAVARALWEARGPFVPWTQLNDSEREEATALAMAAMRAVCEALVFPQYKRCRNSANFGGMAACEYLVAQLQGLSPDQGSEIDKRLSLEYATRVVPSAVSTLARIQGIARARKAENSEVEAARA